MEAINLRFDFLSNNPRIQARALNSIEKRIRAKGVVMPIYEWIEKMESGLEIRECKLYSSKSRNREGYTIKKVIGEHIVDTKAEQDYYLYLENGGQKYSEYLKVKAEQEREQQERAKAERLREEEARTTEAKKQFKKAQEQKYILIEGILSGKTTREGLVNLYTKSEGQYLEYLQTQRQTNEIKETIEIAKRNIEARVKKANVLFDTINSLYAIINGAVTEKYSYKQGIPVWVDYGNGCKIATFYKDSRTNNDGSITHIVEKLEGIYNPYISYELLTPRTI